MEIEPHPSEPDVVMSDETDLAYFHCTEAFCSSVACVIDVQGESEESFAKAKLLCSLDHVGWVNILDLNRVEPYWPETAKHSSP